MTTIIDLIRTLLLVLNVTATAPEPAPPAEPVTVSASVPSGEAIDVTPGPPPVPVDLGDDTDEDVVFILPLPVPESPHTSCLDQHGNLAQVNTVGLAAGHWQSCWPTGQTTVPDLQLPEPEPPTESYIIETGSDPNEAGPYEVDAIETDGMTTIDVETGTVIEFNGEPIDQDEDGE